MTASKLNKHWTLITILLIAIITISSIAACSRYSRSQSVEISISPTPELQDEIYISGAVNNPGFYPLKAEDTVEALIQAAGGTAGSADLHWLKLYIPQTEEKEQPQRIDLNRAEDWLLEALPQIGETRAQAIISYRQQNGSFNNINELIKVEGIGITTCEKIKHLFSINENTTLELFDKPYI